MALDGKLVETDGKEDETKDTEFVNNLQKFTAAIVEDKIRTKQMKRTEDTDKYVKLITASYLVKPGTKTGCFLTGHRYQNSVVKYFPKWFGNTVPMPMDLDELV